MPQRALLFLFAAYLAGCGVDTEPGRQKVKQTLKDPESAQFKSEVIAKSPALFCGEVNAKNSMGGYVGFTRYIVMPSFVAFDGDDSASQLLSAEEMRSEALTEKIRIRAEAVGAKAAASSSGFSESDARKVVPEVIFQDGWEKYCVR